ncbi:hypothetical protein M9458_002787 [Cirrhinus mrigala]|uniref:Uncharacterized protein n=1 Tax=Cirrhinus mrigala TaxID=683832 RepID=A0ABD0RNA2_CIRMR
MHWSAFIYAIQESHHITSDLPETRLTSSDLQESCHITSDFPEIHLVTSDLQESRHVMSDLPEARHVSSDYPKVTSQLLILKDGSLMSAHAAGIPKFIHFSPPAFELTPLSTELPVL